MDGLAGANSTDNREGRGALRRKRTMRRRKFTRDFRQQSGVIASPVESAAVLYERHSHYA
jgi:hypothetical protein